MQTLSGNEILIIFKSLSNESRLAILRWLKNPEKNFPPQDEADLIQRGVCVSQIMAKLNLTQSTASQYLAILYKAGLLEITRVGKWTYYKRNEGVIKELAKFVEVDM